jgi:hypothetical protein
MDKLKEIVDDLNNNKLTLEEALATAYNKGVDDMCNNSIDRSMRMSTSKTTDGKHTYMKATGTKTLQQVKEEISI